MSSHCPKCGSDQILNDECLKCGVLVSRVRSRGSSSDLDSSGPIQPISFVAPSRAAPANPAASSPPPARSLSSVLREAGYSRPREKNNFRANVIWTVILLVFVGGGYQIYKYFVRQASVYRGYYWNSTQRFSLNLPQDGWSHYQAVELQSLDLKDAQDAFYRGDDPDDPEVVMVVWTEYSPELVPDRFDPETSDKILETIETEVLRRMTKASLEPEIAESGSTRVGGNDGFVIRANLKKEQLRLKTIIYCAFNQHSAYTVQFLGKENFLHQSEEEIRRMMASFDFQQSLL